MGQTVSNRVRILRLNFIHERDKLEGNKKIKMDISCDLKTYFSFLPCELIEEIVKYLPIEDYINFCTAVKQSKYLEIIEKFELARCYNVNKVNMKTVPSAINNCEGVTSINLNRCHWLSKNTLHNFILIFPNVQILSALETKFDLTGDDIEILNKTKIYRLAVTLSTSDNGTECSMSKIKELYLEIDKGTLDYFEGNFNKFVKLPNVEKVWVRFLEETHWSQHTRVLRPFINDKWLRNCADDKLKDVIFSLYGKADVAWRIPKSWKSFRKYYETGRFWWSRIVCYEKANNNFQSVLRRDPPLTPKDAKKLYYGEETLETIKCKEFLLTGGYHEMLEAQAGSIEYLEIQNCYDFEHYCLHQSMIKLKHLSLTWTSNVKNWHLISNFTLLEFLHVDIPECKDAGGFLPVVLKNCTFLQKLSLQVSRLGGPYCEDDFRGHFSSALAYANNLKELFIKFDNCIFEIDEIISILNCMKQIKLVKIMMMIDSCRNMNADIWKEYFEHNEQLMDCVIGIRCLNPLFKPIAEGLCTLYARPYRKLRIGAEYYQDLKEEVAEYCSLGLRIDDDFFIINE